ncbi:hypothetical protein NE865_14305 [Phthorimaea operculella]|nr:hypothetical protein NE865_14305 [Phthorimaea operculella]
MKAYARLGKQKPLWRCVDCLLDVGSTDDTSSGSLSKAEQGIAQVLKEIKAFRKEFGGVKADMTKVKSELQTCTNGIQTINKKWSEMETRISQFEDRLVLVEKFPVSIQELQSKLDAASAAISNLQNDNDARDQHARMCNVEISGIPMKKGENLATIFNMMCIKLGLQVPPTSIDSIHRVRRFAAGAEAPEGGRAAAAGGSPSSPTGIPAIIVKFTRRAQKDELLSAVRARRPGLTSADVGIDGPSVDIFVCDHLTPANKLLLKSARKLKKEGKLAHVWVRDCKVLARKADTSKVLYVTKTFDFKKFK